MSEPLEISHALLRNLQNRKWREPELARQFEAGTAITRKASFGRKPVFAQVRTFRAPSERQARRARKRKMAGRGIILPSLRDEFKQGETSVMNVIALECQRKGFCDLCNARIADLAGVCLTTVKNAIRVARRIKALHVQERRAPGRKNFTNLITIFSSEWKAWIKYAGIGGKTLPAYTNGLFKKIFHPETKGQKQPIFPVETGFGRGSAGIDRWKPDVTYEKREQRHAI